MSFPKKDLGPKAVVDVELLGEQEAPTPWPHPFLHLHRVTVRNRYADGSHSAPYAYDAVTRRCMDAVAVVLWREDPTGVSVCLRSQARPPVLLRDRGWRAQPDSVSPVQWELPAGLIEEGDRGLEGIARRAAVEVREETGYGISPSAVTVDPRAPVVSVGVIPERLYFAYAQIDAAARPEAPTGDGSVAEEGSALVWMPLEEALDACRRSAACDMKTELGLRRFADRLA